MAVTSLFVLMLIGFSVLVTIQAARVARERDVAQQERDAAEQVSSFLVGLFEVSDPSRARGNTVTARELLDRGAAQVESGLTEQPTVQARLMDAIGRVYRQLGLFDQSESLLSKALARREGAAEGPSDASPRRCTNWAKWRATRAPTRTPRRSTGAPWRCGGSCTARSTTRWHSRSMPSASRSTSRRATRNQRRCSAPRSRCGDRCARPAICRSP